MLTLIVSLQINLCDLPNIRKSLKQYLFSKEQKIWVSNFFCTILSNPNWHRFFVQDDGFWSLCPSEQTWTSAGWWVQVCSGADGIRCWVRGSAIASWNWVCHVVVRPHQLDHGLYVLDVGVIPFEDLSPGWVSIAVEVPFLLSFFHVHTFFPDVKKAWSLYSSFISSFWLSHRMALLSSDAEFKTFT